MDDGAALVANDCAVVVVDAVRPPALASASPLLERSPVLVVAVVVDDTVDGGSDANGVADVVLRANALLCVGRWCTAAGDELAVTSSAVTGVATGGVGVECMRTGGAIASPLPLLVARIGFAFGIVVVIDIVVVVVGVAAVSGSAAVADRRIFDCDGCRDSDGGSAASDELRNDDERRRSSSTPPADATSVGSAVSALALALALALSISVATVGE